MFDTHCHLNFKAFAGTLETVIKNAQNTGVSLFVVPGTDVETSKRAVQIAGGFDGVWAAVGIHPHHVYELKVKKERSEIKNELKEIEKLLVLKKAVAIGEVGLDKHYYLKTKYPNYQIDETFLQRQKEYLTEQIGLAVKHNKSIIFHNREAKKDFLDLLKQRWDKKLTGRAVFHCCEPDNDLLVFAKRYKLFIGVDGDITFRQDKLDFIKTVPLELLVLETDSPFLLPVQLRGENKNRPHNEPKNLKLIAAYIAEKLSVSLSELEKITEENSKRLFNLF